MTPHGLLPDAGDRGPLMADAGCILVTNPRVAATLLVGACTLGLLTLGHLAWLGYSLG